MKTLVENLKPSNEVTLPQMMGRVGQVWEDRDGWVYFIVGTPRVNHYKGSPFLLEHVVLAVTPAGDVSDWPLFETIDRPLEVRHKRLA